MQLTIATSPKAGLDLTNDITLVRAALLYADRVVLCSPAYSILLLLLRMSKLTPEEQTLFSGTSRFKFRLE